MGHPAEHSHMRAAPPGCAAAGKHHILSIYSASELVPLTCAAALPVTLDPKGLLTGVQQNPAMMASIYRSNLYFPESIRLLYIPCVCWSVLLDAKHADILLTNADPKRGQHSCARNGTCSPICQPQRYPKQSPDVLLLSFNTSSLQPISQNLACPIQWTTFGGAPIFYMFMYAGRGSPAS